MTSLEDAWIWYENNRKLVRLMARLGERYWLRLPWDGLLERDDNFRVLEGEDVVADASLVLGELDDLAVFVLFSVFEASVRQLVLLSMEAEVANLKHPALRRSSQKLMQNIEDGSFYTNVLELFKREGTTPEGQVANSLIEQVNRIRRYRNWVAHGRKPTEKPNPVPPKEGFDVLKQFLHFVENS